MQRALWLASILILGAVAPAAAEWPMFQGDNLNQGRADDIVRDDQLWWTWSTPPGGHLDAAPVVAEGTVIVADTTGLVTALDAESGRMVWEHTMAAGVSSTPAVAFGWAYVADVRGNLVALDLRDGSVVAETTIGATRAPITIAEGKLFIGNEDGEMQAFTATTLDLLWTFPVSQASEGWETITENNATSIGTCSGDRSDVHPARPIRAAPAVHMGVVVFGAMNHYVYAVDEQGNPDQTTDLQWRHRTGDIILASPVVDTATLRVYLAGYDETLRSLPVLSTNAGINPCIGDDVSPGWLYDVPGPIDASKVHSTPAFDGKRLYFGANNGNIYAVDAATGAEVWQVATGGPVLASPVVANGTVVVGSDDGVVRWLDADTGNESLRFQADAPVKMGVAALDGTVIIATEDGTLYRMGGTPPPRADLEVTSIERQGNGVAITITNIGAVPSTPTVAQVWDNGTMAMEQELEAIPSGGTIEIFYLAIGHVGPLLIDVVIDPEQLGLEAGRENNQRSQVVFFIEEIDEGNLTLEPEATGPAGFLGMPWWAWLIIGGVVLSGGGVGTWFVWRRRSTEYETSDDWYDDEEEEYDYSEDL